jgi:peptide methionine sulfoxide reductase MsrA
MLSVKRERTQLTATTSFQFLVLGCLCLFLRIHEVSALSFGKSRSVRGETEGSWSRRSFLGSGAAIAATGLGLPIVANAEEEAPIEVYFGCGCFWHVQHELVEAERRILGRSDSEITARAGYAGGSAGAKNGKVCYHNALSISDYGALGHGEVVSVQIPPSKFPDFVAEYCNLFSEQGYRPDQAGDRGLEYRNLVGIPGGVDGSFTKQLIDASIKTGDKLNFARGKGDDADQRALVWVMDSNKFPFYVAEQYHQFHDGFNFGENYPNSYNGLANKLNKEGTLGKSDCPNGLIGVGALGL